jgi:LPXTG-site transpeptidase (sortase) family protein
MAIRTTPWKRIERGFRRGLGITGLALLGTWAGATFTPWAVRHLGANRWDAAGPDDSRAAPRETSDALEGGVAWRARAAAMGDEVLGTLEIPRLGISIEIREGDGAATLWLGVAHLTDTAFPGERGNVGLAGHRDTHLRKLKDVALGDLIRISTGDGSFSYRVESIEVVDRSRVDVLAATAQPKLTLVTCHPFRWIGSAPHRFIVSAGLYREGTKMSGRETATPAERAAMW